MCPILQVHPETDPSDLEQALKRSYRRLAQKYHPDVGQEKDGERMKNINQAYGILSDPEKRAKYLRGEKV